MPESQLKPKDQIIQYIRRSLNDGSLKPNTRLPSERSLAERFNISRSAVREALKTLENFGILKTLPQSGSVIVGLDIHAIDGLLSDIIKLDAADFASLVEMRVILEVSAARLCAERCDKEDIENMERMLDSYIEATNNPTTSAAERTNRDFAYHRAIAMGSKNSVLRSMQMFISPEIMSTYSTQDICANDTSPSTALKDHQLILKYIKEGDADRAAQEMSRHLSGVLTYAQSLRESK